MNKWLIRFAPGFTVVILTIAVAFAACTEDPISTVAEPAPGPDQSELRTPDGLSALVAGVARAFAL